MKGAGHRWLICWLSTYNEWVETVAGLNDEGGEIDQNVPLYRQDDGVGLQEEEGEKIACYEEEY